MNRNSLSPLSHRGRGARSRTVFKMEKEGNLYEVIDHLGERSLLLNNRVLTQHPTDKPWTGSSYATVMARATLLNPKMAVTWGGVGVVLGIGGGTVCHTLKHLYSPTGSLAAHWKGVDNDPWMLEIAREYFDVFETGISGVPFKDQPIVMDAVKYMSEHTIFKKFDAILIDCNRDANGELNTSIYNKETLTNWFNRLTPDGLMILNSNAISNIGFDSMIEPHHYRYHIKRFERDWQPIYVLSHNPLDEYFNRLNLFASEFYWDLTIEEDYNVRL